MRFSTTALLGLAFTSNGLAQDVNIAISKDPSPSPTPRPSSSSVSFQLFSSSSGSKPSSTSKTPAATHTITVGQADHKFRPDVTQAEVGDTIEFQFFPANHSVVRAEYGYPCIPYEMTGKGKSGFFAGFHPVDAILDNPPKWTIKINDSSPIFFYCSAPGSCTNYGMVGVINPNASTSLAAHRDLALNSAYSLNPGDPFPAESSTLPTQNPLTSQIPPLPHSSSSKALPAGAIAGIVIGSLVVVALAAILFFYVGRSRSLKQEVLRKGATIRHVTPPSPMLQAHYAKYVGGSGPAEPVVHGPPQYSAAEGTMATDWAARSLSPAPSGSAPSRMRSVRSVGGTFDLSPTTGYYTRTHDGEDRYKYVSPVATDLGSPEGQQVHHWPPNEKVGSPNEAFPLGPYGRQVTGTPPPPGYPGPSGAVNEGMPAELPVEMDGTGGRAAGNANERPRATSGSRFVEGNGSFF